MVRLCTALTLFAAAIHKVAWGASTPSFSWDVLPQFIHCANDTGALSDEMVAAMTAPAVHFVVIEKYQCLQCDPLDDAGEAKELASAQLIKAARADQTVIFYFAIDYARTWYTLGRWFDGNPSLEVHNADNSLANVSSEGFTWHIWDLAQETAREEWVKDLVFASATGLVDGFFIDGYRSPSSWGNQLLPNATAQEQAAWVAGANITGGMLADAVPGSIRIINPGSLISNYQGYNAVSLEFFDASLSSINELLSLNGTMVEVHVYAGTNDQLFNTSLAAYLVAASEMHYYGAGNTWNTCESWLIPHVEYSKALGAPTGLATVNGTVWTRTFASGTVASVDTSQTPSKTCIVWADGYKTGAGCYGANPLL